MPGFVLSRYNAAIVVRALVRERHRLEAEIAAPRAASDLVDQRLEVELANIDSLLLVLRDFMDGASDGSGPKSRTGRAKP